MNEAAIAVEPAFCRMCLGFCGINVTVVDGRVTKVVGDPTSPLTGGFTCSKGRSIPEQLTRSDRLLGAMRRGGSGALVPVPSNAAAQEVAERLGTIVERWGPRAVALYQGTGSSGYALNNPVGAALWMALGSDMVFNPAPIDQPGKAAAAALHGRWAGGAWTPAEADVWTFIGTNPLVSMWAGTSMVNPAGQLRRGRARGARVVVIDPRRTELAAFADVHLAVRPGEDPVVLAGILRLLFESGYVDGDFIDRHASGADVLRAAVDPFEVRPVCERANIRPRDLEMAADIIGGSRRGGISAGTGPNMSPRSTLTEYLILAVTTVLGYWRREGDPLANPGVLIPPRSWKEQALPHGSGILGGDVVRDGAISVSAAGRQTAHVADDILGEAPDRVRALVNVGGNPVLAWPGASKVRRAMERLDLLVTFDVAMSATAQLSDVVFGTKFHLETPNITMNEGIRGYGAACEPFSMPFAMYMPARSAPPPDSDLVEEWQVFHAIARRLGIPLVLNGVDLATLAEPTTDDALEILLSGAVIGLEELRRHPRGKVFDVAAVVGPADPARPDDLRLRLDDPWALGELMPLLDTVPDNAPFRLVVRRSVRMKNSWGGDSATTGTWFPRANPLWMHPDDMDALDVVTGDKMDVRSAHGTLRCLVEEDSTTSPGVVALSHGWGGPGRPGVNVNELTDDLDAGDSMTDIPVMSAIGVWLTPAGASS